MTTASDTPTNGPIFFSKQPILDGDRRIWGYELLGGEVRQGIFQVFPQEESAAASLSSSTYYGLQDAMARGKKILVAFDARSVVEGLPHALPAENGVLRLSVGATLPPQVREKLTVLRADGYQVAVDVTGPEVATIAATADIMIFDFGVSIPPESAWGGTATLLARNVRTLEQFHNARQLGFALFQGPFFKEPDLIPGRKLSSNEVSRLHMLKVMESRDPDLEGIAAAVKADVAVSFRLLSLLNSAAFGLSQKINSVDHAVRLLGWVHLKKWLRAVLLADMAGQADGPKELAVLSMQRGRFLELVTTEYDYWGFQPETMFLLGMFSLLDTILGMPMAAVVELLPLDSKLKDALRREPNNEHMPLFELLNCLEDGDWPALETLSARLGMDQEEVKKAYAAAMDWASLLLSSEAA